MLFRSVSVLVVLVMIQLALGVGVFASGSYQYEYDLNNRLMGIKKNGIYIKKFTYDANGNQLTSTIEGRPEAALTFPTGSESNPSSIDTAVVNIAWTQTASPASGAFEYVQIQVRDAGGALAWDSGTLNQPTSTATGSFEWVSALPQNEKFQLRLRVKDSESWSSWTESGWFVLNDAEEIDNLIKNGGFEKAYGDSQYYWDHRADAFDTGEIALVSTPVVKGARALKIEATGLASWARAQVLQSVAVEGGKAYLLSGDVYTPQLQNAFAELHIQYYNASNSSLGQDYVRQETAITGFAHLEKRSVAPEGTVRAQVSVRLSANAVGNGSGLLYADNIDLRETTDPNLLVNADFEHTLDTSATNWQSFNAGTGTIGSTYSPVASGSKAMKIEAANLPIWQSGYIRQRINVEAGQTFKLSGQLHAEELNNSSGQLLVWFYDEDWTEVGSFTAELNQTTEGYVYLEKQGIIPEGTVLAEVGVHLTANQSGGSGTLYADALKFEYEEPLIED
ncbi:hypothetical protein ACFFT4_09825, partial [Cohnella cellulosilytica]